MRAWFPCAWCPWEGDIDFRWVDDTNTVVFDCPACHEENRDAIEDDPDYWRT